MKYILISITVVTLLITIYMKKTPSKNNNNIEKNNIVRVPRIVGAVGVVACIAGAAFPLLADVFSPESNPVTLYISSIALILAGIAMCISEANWRIDYDNNGFKYKTMFGKKIEFLYSDIKNIKDGNQSTKIYTTSKTLRISKDNVGAEAFVDRCRWKMSQME